jgi:hypothetical protein
VSGTQHGFTPVQGQSNGALARKFAATRGKGAHTGLTKTHHTPTRTRRHGAHTKPVHVKDTPAPNGDPTTPKPHSTPKATAEPKTAPTPKSQPAPNAKAHAPKAGAPTSSGPAPQTTPAGPTASAPAPVVSPARPGAAKGDGKPHAG